MERIIKSDAGRVEYYIDTYFTEVDKSSIAPHREEFGNVYRNGLVHEFFPKMSGVGRGGSFIMSEHNGQWVLDADLFAAMFIRSADILRNIARSDEDLCLRMYDRYLGKQKDNYQLKFLRPNISTSAIACGATISMIPTELLNKASQTRNDID